ncbi:MAG: Bug family tripartite tricarboxylate transporter substrate binding protein [Parvibaculaceae bacterium]
MFRILAIACSLLLWANPVGAQSNPFDGKTITYIVATKPGGGYDTMGRLVSRYLEKHLPGSRIIVKNIPGGGHLVGAKMIYAADPDGLTIGTFNTGLVYWQMTAGDLGDLDLTKMSWIGKAASESRVLIVSTKSAVRTIGDFRNPDRPVKMASSGKGSAAYQEAKLLASALGLNVEIIPGFEGTEAEMSMLRGEIDANLGSASSLKPFIDNGNGKILLEIGGKPDSDLPQASALAETAEAKSIISLIETQAQLSRLTAAPPGLAPEQLNALRAAYLAALADPGLLAEAKKLDLPIAPAGGEIVDERIRATFDHDPETLVLLKRLLTGG